MEQGRSKYREISVLSFLIFCKILKLKLHSLTKKRIKRMHKILESHMKIAHAKNVCEMCMELASSVEKYPEIS